MADQRRRVDLCRSQHHISTPKGTPKFQPKLVWGMEKWPSTYKNGNSSEAAEDRSKVTINGLHETRKVVRAIAHVRHGKESVGYISGGENPRPQEMSR